MNMRILFVSLLAVATVSRAELDVFAAVSTNRVKVEGTKEYQELVQFRANTQELRNIAHVFDKQCYLNKSWMAYFSAECDMARAFKEALELRPLQDKELLAKVQATPEYLEVYPQYKK